MKESDLNPFLGRQIPRRDFLMGMTTVLTGGLVVACGGGKEVYVDETSSVSQTNFFEEGSQIELKPQEQLLLADTNRVRIYEGMKPLEKDGTLVKLARIRCEDMARRNYFGHVSPSNLEVFDLLRQINYHYSLAGENIAKNNYPPKECEKVAFEGLMASPGHRSNILGSTYNKLGIGHFRDNSGMHYFVQIFANHQI